MIVTNQKSNALNKDAAKWANNSQTIADNWQMNSELSLCRFELHDHITLQDTSPKTSFSCCLRWVLKNTRRGVLIQLCKRWNWNWKFQLLSHKRWNLENTCISYFFVFKIQKAKFKNICFSSFFPKFNFTFTENTCFPPFSRFFSKFNFAFTENTCFFLFSFKV